MPRKPLGDRPMTATERSVRRNQNNASKAKRTREMLLDAVVLLKRTEGGDTVPPSIYEEFFKRAMAALYE